MSAVLLGHRRTLSVSEYAEAAGISEQAVRRRLRSGQLRGRRLKNGQGAWRAFASQLRDAGR